MRLALANRSRRAKEEIESTNVRIINLAKIPPFGLYIKDNLPFNLTKYHAFVKMSSFFNKKHLFPLLKKSVKKP